MPHKESHESRREGGGGGKAKNEKSGGVNLGENNRMKYKEGEISSCRAYRRRLNNAWIRRGMAVEQMHHFEMKFSNCKPLLSPSLSISSIFLIFLNIKNHFSFQVSLL